MKNKSSIRSSMRYTMKTGSTFSQNRETALWEKMGKEQQTILPSETTCWKVLWSSSASTSCNSCPLLFSADTQSNWHLTSSLTEMLGYNCGMSPGTKPQQKSMPYAFLLVQLHLKGHQELLEKECQGLR